MFSNYTRRLLHFLRLNEGHRRLYSTPGNLIEKTVIISESNDIYTNLALEDWYYRNWKFDNRHLLILWSNDPCVVVGKFQNPWLEANVSQLDRLTCNGVKLARRNSGGGTVYHDRGNLNLTFFTPREHYNRKHNLEVIKNAIWNQYGLEIEITKRDDLVVGDCKVSGTAAKLARTVAYHHCTLLVNSDKKTLRDSLRKPSYNVETNATRSTSSKILNLTDINPNVSIKQLMLSIGLEYLATTVPVSSKRKNIEEIEGNRQDIDDFKKLYPTEEAFPGLTKIRDTHVSWEWIYGKCPKFIASKMIPGEIPAKVMFVIENGRVTSTQIQFAKDSNPENADNELEHFKNKKFCEELFDEVIESYIYKLPYKMSHVLPNKV